MATTIETIHTPSDSYTVEEVMRRLLYGQKSRASFWECVHAQNIPRVRINARKYLFPKAAFEQWIISRSVGVAK